MKTQWERCQATNSRCVLDTSMPSNPDAFGIPQVCSQGSIPEYAVCHIPSIFPSYVCSQMSKIDVKTAEDVLVGYNFSRIHSIPLVIKNTGVSAVDLVYHTSRLRT